MMEPLGFNANINNQSSPVSSKTVSPAPKVDNSTVSPSLAETVTISTEAQRLFAESEDQERILSSESVPLVESLGNGSGTLPPDPPTKPLESGSGTALPTAPNQTLGNGSGTLPPEPPTKPLGSSSSADLPATPSQSLGNGSGTLPPDPPTTTNFESGI